MHVLSAPLLAGAVLLAFAGALKLRRPAGTAQALRTQGLPSAHVLVRLMGAVEVGLASAVLASLPFAALGLAVAYAAFTGFVAVALVRGRPLSSCGCFAEPDLPPTRAHLAVTALFAAVGAGGSVGASTGVPALLGVPVGTAVATVLSAALVAWLAYLVLADLPRLQAAARPLPEQHDGPQLFTLVPVRSTTP
jgi:hypothetical protein